MGNSGVSLGAGLAAGLAVVAISVFSYGTLTPVALALAGLAFTAASYGTQMLLGQPKVNTGQDSTSERLQFSTASESYAIPVVFGTARMAGNFIRVEKKTFRNVAITESGSAGGKGGSSSESERTVGYRYFLSWEYAWCMGPIDRVWSIVSNPGERELLANPRNFSGGHENLDLESKDHEEQGPITMYQGNGTQTRTGSNDPYDKDEMNYRHVCWALFKDFEMGRRPAPNSYLAEITRWPDGLPSQIRKRGSDNENDSAYYDANPAAILYEILTNTVWGRGLDEDYLDLDSFERASIYFENQNIGLSFMLETQNSLADAVESIRTHVNTWVIWTGQKLKCICLMDVNTVYDDPITIEEEQVMDVQFTRPMWPATINEVRAEYVSRSNRYQTEIVLAQDLANIQLTGGISSQKIGLRGFSSRKKAQKAVQRILQDFSYPRASLKFRMNRFNSKMLAGDFLIFKWAEWTAGNATTYWRVVSINDSDQDPNGIEVSCTEDQYKPGHEGAPDDEFEAPIDAWEDTDSVGDEAEANEDGYADFGDPVAITSVTSTLTYFEVTTTRPHGLADGSFVAITGVTPSDYNSTWLVDEVIDAFIFRVLEGSDFGTATPEEGDIQSDILSIAPVSVIEPNIWLSNYEPRYMVFAQRRSDSLLSMHVTLGLEGSGDLVNKGDLPCWSITGTLSADLPIQTRHIERERTLNLALGFADDVADFLEAASLVQTGADDFGTLTGAKKAMLFVGNEIIQVGYATDNGSGSVTIRNFVRGCWGTEQEAHSNGDAFNFVPDWARGLYTQKYDIELENEALDFIGYPVTISGSVVERFVEFEPDNADHELTGRSRAPFPPQYHSVVQAGLDWTVKIRPRFHDKGAGVGSFQHQMTEPIASLGGLTFLVKPFMASSSNGARVAPDQEYLADTMDDSTGGMVTIEYTLPAGSDELRIWASLNGVLSKDYISVT